MFQLVVLFLVGSAIVVAASKSSPSSSSSPSSVGPLLLKSLPISNKFADPVLTCIGRMKIPVDVGLNYLASAPDSAAGRVDAMRARIGALPPADRVSFPNTDAGELAEASFKQIQSLGIKLQSVYSDSAQWAGLASAFGIPMSEIEKQAKDISSLSKTVTQSEFIRQAAKYQPIAQTLMQGVAGLAGGLNRDQVINQAASMIGRAAAMAAADVVPIVGAVINLATDLYMQSALSRQAAKRAECDGWKSELANLKKKAFAEGFPVPIHLLSDLGNVCDSERNEYFAESVLRGSTLAFRTLTLRDRAFVTQWWSLALSLMSHPEVYAVFDRLGHGLYAHDVPGLSNDAGSGNAPPFGNGFGFVGSTGLYGGALASDEQVMMVAAPFAIANGYSVDYFARALWQACRGWRDADSTSFLWSKNRDRSLRFAINNTGDPNDDVVVYACPNVPCNAWHLQWAALARQATILTQSLKKG